MHPDDARVWIFQGIALQGLHRPEESLKAFEHALQIDPGNVAALEGAAQLEFQAGKPDAQPFLEKLLELEVPLHPVNAHRNAVDQTRKTSSVWQVRA